MHVMIVHLKSLTVVVTCAAIIIMLHLLSCEANVEFDNLALEFQNGFELISKKTGFTLDSNKPPTSIGEAEKRMRDFYTSLERSLKDARQRAANSRSTLTSSTIEKLNLV